MMKYAFSCTECTFLFCLSILCKMQCLRCDFHFDESMAKIVNAEISEAGIKRALSFEGRLNHSLDQLFGNVCQIIAVLFCSQRILHLVCSVRAFHSPPPSTPHPPSPHLPPPFPLPTCSV